MNTAPFLDYLHEYDQTRVLADELAAVLAVRSRRECAPVAGADTTARRIAS